MLFAKAQIVAFQPFWPPCEHPQNHHWHISQLGHFVNLVKCYKMHDLVHLIARQVLVLLSMKA